MTEDEFGNEIDKLVQKIQVLEMRLALETKAKLELSVEVMEWQLGIRTQVVSSRVIQAVEGTPPTQHVGPISPLGLPSLEH